MIFLNVDLNAQNINIKGKVIDVEGNVLPALLCVFRELLSALQQTTTETMY
jgi:hypothetical protein